jgi:hypothetical protein
MQEVLRTLRSVRGILNCIPFDKPFISNRFNISTDELKGIPLFIRQFFDIAFIYSDKAQFEACCILQKAENTYTIIIIIQKRFEIDFHKQESTSIFLNRNYIDVCRRRALYCHEVCHLIAIIRAFPSHQNYQDNKSFLKNILFKFVRSPSVIEDEKKFFSKTKKSFKKILNNIQALLPFSLPADFNDKDDPPDDFDREHFPYKGDELNYFKLFGELMVSDKDLKKVIEKLQEHKKEGKVEIIDGLINLQRYIMDFLHVDLTYILKRAPEKKRIIIDELRKIRI